MKCATCGTELTAADPPGSWQCSGCRDAARISAYWFVALFATASEVVAKGYYKGMLTPNRDRITEELENAGETSRCAKAKEKEDDK